MYDVAIKDVARHVSGDYRSTLMSTEQRKEQEWNSKRKVEAALIAKIALAVIIGILIMLCLIMAIIRKRKAAFPKTPIPPRSADMSPNNAAQLNGVLSTSLLIRPSRAR